MTPVHIYQESEFSVGQWHAAACSVSFSMLMFDEFDPLITFELLIIKTWSLEENTWSLEKVLLTINWTLITVRKQNRCTQVVEIN